MLSKQFSSNLLKNSAISALVLLQSGCQAQNSSLSGATKVQSPGFELREPLGRSWQNELVTFPASAEDIKNAEAKRALLGPDGKAVPYQVISAVGNKKQIAFIADLAPYTSGAFRFTITSTPAASDLQIEENGPVIRLANKLTGITIRKALSDGEAPIESVRLVSGQWVGGSALQGTAKVADYSARITARGPAFAEVLCQMKFENGKEWRMRIRLNAGEPVVVVSEEYSVGEQAAWTLDLSRNFSPTHVLHRMGRSSAGGRVGTVKSWTIAADAEPAFVMEPWLRWYMRDRQGNWFGLYNENSSDLLSLGALRPAQWLDPKKNNTENITVPVTQTANGLQARFTLKDGTRFWLIAALDKDDSTTGLGADPKVATKAAPLPQEYVIKHGDYPLDEVKDYVLEWKGSDGRHPRLVLTADELTSLRGWFKPDAAKLERLMKVSLSVYNISESLEYYLGSGDSVLGRKLADFALQQTKEVADSYLNQAEQMTLGFAPHHNRWMQTVINVLDVVYDSILTEDERTKVKAQLAFLGYTVTRDDYWSPERGYAANPNMTSMVAGYQAQIGMMLASHPRSKDWANEGLTELKHELDEWSDTEGGWLEAPAYAMASYDFLLGMFLIARNTGYADYLYEPRMKKLADWFANISTPPDKRVAGIRHTPPIGNTYINQPTGEFGILAYLWKDKDPEFAQRMQWMYKQHGEFAEAGIGGFSPSLAGFRGILSDPTIAAKKPEYRSTLYPETGVLLRNGVDDRETQLHLIAGDNHAHYDDDSGSITLWGKGRIVADDFGYYGMAPPEDHNMIDSPLRGGQLSVMKVRSFETDPNFDYVYGVNNGWQRRIAFVKDSDMMAPNYFIIRDSLDVPTPAKWRLWLAAAQVQVKSDGALAVGKDDVDTDIIFTTPQNLELKTEEKTKSSYGLDANLKYGAISTTQTGLLADVPRAQSFVTVVYPRLKTQRPPVVTSLAEGRVLKVEHEAGTDFVFMSDRPFTFKQDGINFQGTSALVKVRGTKTQVALGEGGKVTANGQSREKPVKAAKAFSYNLFENGDVETAVPLPFNSTELDVSIQDGDPAPGSNLHKGRYSMAFTLKEDSGRNISVLFPKIFYVDATKTYRVRFKAYTDKKINLSAGGYGNVGGHKDNILTPEGKVWSYGLSLGGPLPEWKEIQTTIGPAGSKAEFIWPANLLSTSFTLWISGEKGTLYLDDFAFEPVVP